MIKVVPGKAIYILNYLLNKSWRQRQKVYRETYVISTTNEWTRYSCFALQTNHIDCKLWFIKLHLPSKMENFISASAQERTKKNAFKDESLNFPCLLILIDVAAKHTEKKGSKSEGWLWKIEAEVHIVLKPKKHSAWKDEIMINERFNLNELLFSISSSFASRFSLSGFGLLCAPSPWKFMKHFNVSSFCAEYVFRGVWNEQKKKKCLIIKKP